MPLFLLPWLVRAKSLLSSPLVQYALMFLAVLAVLYGLYWKGHSDGYNVCDQAHKAAAAAEVTRQDKAQDAAVDASRDKTAEDTKVDAANADHVAAAVAKINAPRPVRKPAKPEQVVITGKKVDDHAEPPQPDFASAVCVPSDVADELRAIH